MIILVQDERNDSDVAAALSAILEASPETLTQFLSWARQRIRRGSPELSYEIPVPSAPPLRARLASLTRMLLIQIETRDDDGSCLEHLTRRQSDVARLAAFGQSNSEIGYALGISHETVKRHLAAVYRKLDVGSRTELAHQILRSSQDHPPGNGRPVPSETTLERKTP